MALSLKPREHGAYGQLFVPLITALLMRRPTVAALLLGASGVLLFFSHEPLLVLLGQRGARARREAGGRALRLLALLSALAATAGTVGLWMSPAARRTALIVGALATVALALAVLKKGRTLAGETSAALALAAVSWLVALAAGVEPQRARAMFLIWALGFAAVTWAVRSAVRAFKEGLPRPVRVAGLVPLALLVPALYFTGVWTGAETALGFLLPMLSLGLAWFAPHPRQLKRVGWTLVLATCATGLGLVMLGG